MGNRNFTMRRIPRETRTLVFLQLQIYFSFFFYFLSISKGLLRIILINSLRVITFILLLLCHYWRRKGTTGTLGNHRNGHTF